MREMLVNYKVNNLLYSVKVNGIGGSDHNVLDILKCQHDDFSRHLTRGWTVLDFPVRFMQTHLILASDARLGREVLKDYSVVSLDLHQGVGTQNVLRQRSAPARGSDRESQIAIVRQHLNYKICSQLIHKLG